MPRYSVYWVEESIFCHAFCELDVEKLVFTCLLYTSDAADDMQCVDLGGRRIIKKRWILWCIVVDEAVFLILQ